MNIRRLACILLPLAAISCQLLPTPSVATSAESKSEPKKGTISVTLDGREATPEETEAFGALGKKLFTDALSQAINEFSQELLEKLDIADPIEIELLSVPFGPESPSGDKLLSVYLIRPAKETKEPRTIVLLRDGEPMIRFTRVTAPAERPMAIMSLTSTKDGRLTQTETFLVHSDGKWRQYHPNERHETVK